MYVLSDLCSLPEAMKDKAMEADRLFRRGCLQYLDDFGLGAKQMSVLKLHDP